MNLRNGSDRSGIREIGSAIPAETKRRLAGIGAGWVLAALAEASAYTVLAVAIRDRGGILPVLGAATASLVITVLVSRSGYLTGARMAGDLYAGLGRALARAKLSWFSAENRALIATAAGRSIPSLMGVPAHQLQTLICAALVPIAMVVAVAIVCGGAAAGALALLLGFAFAAQLFAQRRLQRADAERSRLERDATLATVELVEHLELLRTAAGPRRALDRAEQAWAGQERAMARTNRAAMPATFVSAVAGIAPLAGMLILLAAGGGFAEPAAALALVVLTTRAGAPLEDLALVGIALNDARAHLAAYRTVATAPSLPAVNGGAAVVGHPAVVGHDPVVVGHAIRLDAVGHPPALRGVTASIPAGARVHIAGPSGSGKSTLLGLLMRFDDPERGSITLGGAPLTSLGEAQIAARIAYVPQHPVVFTGTLATNLRLGSPDASDEEILRAARRAQLGEVIDRDPLGLHQPVGVHGQALSGGERQRVAIARALVKGAPVLMLDEATSALDEQTERRIADAISDLDATLLLVTHRDPAPWRPDSTIVLKGA